MFPRVPIKHCKNCGNAVVYRLPDDGDTKPRAVNEFHGPNSKFPLTEGHKGVACANTVEAENEKDEVKTHYENFFMNSFDIGPASALGTLTVLASATVCFLYALIAGILLSRSQRWRFNVEKP